MQCNNISTVSKLFSAVDMMDITRGKKMVTNTKCGWQKRSNRPRLCTLCVQYWFCV